MDRVIISIHGPKINGFAWGENNLLLRAYFTPLRIIGPSSQWRHFEVPNPASYRFFHPSIGGSKILRVPEWLKFMVDV